MDRDFGREAHIMVSALAAVVATHLPDEALRQMFLSLEITRTRAAHESAEELAAEALGAIIATALAARRSSPPAPDQTR